MQNSDYIVMQGWMVSSLGLTGASLKIYALVWGYTKDGESWYITNMCNLMEWTMAAERTVRYHLTALTKAQYIIREDTGKGRGSQIRLKASQDIIERALAGEQFAYEVEKGAKIAPIEKGAKIAEKGAKIAESPYLKYILNNNINIILRAHTRTKKEEQEEYFIIFFFRGAADPAAETTAFMRWNESKEEWESTPLRRRYYFAGQWTISNFREPHLRAFRDAWAGIYNYAREKGLDYGCLLDGRIALNITRDSQTGTVEAELRVTAAARDLLQAHHESTTQQYINPLIKGRVNNCRWTIIDGQ